MDKRIKKTRKTIFEVFLNLLGEKSINEITTQEIAEQAEISRSTFYQHYTDVYNLLDQAEDELFNEIYDLLEGYSDEAIQADPLRLFTELFYYFRQNSKICLVLINKNGSITTGQRISKMIQKKFKHEWEALLGCDDDLLSRYLSHYIISGFVGILQEWIAGGMREPEEHMAAIARTFINSSISHNNKTQTREEDLEMFDFKEKIHSDAKSFAGGVLQDTSALLSEKSTEIQKKVETGLFTASSRLAEKGGGLKVDRSTDDIARKRQKIIKRKTELDEKYKEKAAKLTQEGKGEKLEEARRKFEEEMGKLNRQLQALEEPAE